jgi:hypothetical protein
MKLKPRKVERENLILPKEVKEEFEVIEQIKKEEDTNLEYITLEGRKWREKMKGVELANALNQLNIPVYSPVAVEKYKKERVKEKRRFLNRKKRRNKTAGIVSIVFSFLFFYFFSIILEVERSKFSYTFFVIFSVLIILGWALLFLSGLYLMFKKERKWRWSEIGFREYLGATLFEMWDAVCMIEEVLPGAEFYIEEFSDGVKKEDKLLKVVYGDREYYLAL